MTNEPSLRDRLKGTNPQAVKEAEAARQKEMAEQNKAKARDRELARWYDEPYGSRKAARVFTATVGNAAEETVEGTSTSTGEMYSTDFAVFPLTDVEVEEGGEVTELRIRLPEQGKQWSQHSEGAVTVRESEGTLSSLFDLEGKRLRFEGDWMPTFIDAKGFWKGTYYFRVSPAEAAAPVEADPANLTALVNWCVGKTKAQCKTSALLNAVQNELGLKGPDKDAGLEALIMGGFLDYAGKNGLLVLDGDTFVAVE